MTFKVSDNQYGRPTIATAGLLVHITVSYPLFQKSGIRPNAWATKT